MAEQGYFELLLFMSCSNFFVFRAVSSITDTFVDTWVYIYHLL